MNKNKQDKIKYLIKSIKEETELGYKGMDEYTEDLLDTGVCTCHFDNIHDLICELEKVLEV